MSSGTSTRTFEKNLKNNEEKQKILKFGTNPKFVKISSELNVDLFVVVSKLKQKDKYK